MAFLGISGLVLNNLYWPFKVKNIIDFGDYKNVGLQDSLKCSDPVKHGRVGCNFNALSSPQSARSVYLLHMSCEMKVWWSIAGDKWKQSWHVMGGNLEIRICKKLDSQRGFGLANSFNSVKKIAFMDDTSRSLGDNLQPRLHKSEGEIWTGGTGTRASVLSAFGCSVR